jgi:hypothetical protein
LMKSPLIRIMHIICKVENQLLILLRENSSNNKVIIQSIIICSDSSK